MPKPFELLLDCGTEGDVAEAQSVIDRAANLPADKGLVLRDIWLLRLRARLARTYADEARYREYRDRYRDMAKRLASSGMSPGPRQQCHDGDRSGGMSILS